MADSVFEKSVFINCPFDSEFEPILQAILFCATYLGFHPRLALETLDSGRNRLDKIQKLIKSSKFSIHDLSRCQANSKGEHFRLNMPFELGIDYGCRQYLTGRYKTKRFLILEEQKFRYQATISDLSGCDIEAHNADFQIAIRKVRNWLVSEAGADAIGPTKILQQYADFQEWYIEKHLAAGASKEDILDFPTNEFLAGMIEWNSNGRPAPFY